MKLKQVVGSLFLLGLASASAFAADNSTQAQLDSMKAQIAKMEAAMNQNQPGGFEQADGWFNRITVSGEANVDGSFANRSPILYNQHSGDVSDIYVRNANLYIDAQASDWTKAHVGFVYGQSAPDFLAVQAGTNNNGSTNVIDEAYVNIANFAKSPFFLKAGKQRIAFGDYQPYADITPSFTQLLTETTATAATVGFIDASGFNGSIYTFRGVPKAGGFNDQGLTRVQNYGASLGFVNTYADVGYKVGVQYIRNMADVNMISKSLYHSDFDTNHQPVYNDTVGGIAANVSINYSAVDASAKYVSALQRFNVADVAYTDNKGAKPSAWGVDAGYSFPTMGHTSRFGLGYQGSKQASLLETVSLAKTRYLADYTVNVSKFTDLGFEVRNDRAYSKTTGGNGRNATTGTVRLAVKFA